MEHVQPLQRPFPWRAAAVAACILALAELIGLVALVGVGLIPIHHSTQTRPEGTRPVPGTGRVSKRQSAIPLRSRSRVSVLVLNGNGIANAAGTEADQLLSGGYRRATASDAPQHYASSLVLFRGGWEREAHRLARDTKIGTVAPLDGRLVPAEAGYQLILILGSN